MEVNYSIKERAIARILSRFPRLKKGLKRIYQIINYYRFREKVAYESDFEIDSLNLGEAFFGYYDKSPLSDDGKFLLCHTANSKTSDKPDPSIPISINLIDFPSKKVVWEYSSIAYNWQQGSRLQWVGEDEFIFNVYDDDKNAYGAIKYNIATKSVKKIDFPIYDCFQNIFSLSLNYCRLNSLSPDYGYRNIDSLTDRQLREINEDGIFYIDLVENSVSLFISLKQIIAQGFEDEMSDSLHTVNHIMISPNGKNAMFIHRYYNKRKERKDRLLLLDIQSKKLRVLIAYEMVSHCTWVDDSNILGYLRNNLGVDSYYLINICENSIHEVDSRDFLNLGDGHPSVKDDKLLYDTYPNKARMKSLFVYNLDTKINTCLGRFREPLNYNGETRCDLHPRFSFDGKIVFFDSVHTGIRNLYWVKS